MEQVQQSFWLSYIADAETEKIFRRIHHVLTAVLKNLSIRDYAPDTSNFILIIASTVFPGWQEKERMVARKKTREIEVYINLDNTSVLSANDAELKKLIARAYLSAISRFLSKRKDFDHLKFYADAERVFKENGLLE